MKKKVKWPTKAIEIRIPIYEQTVWLCTDKETYLKTLEFMDINPSPLGQGVARWANNPTTNETLFIVGVFKQDLGVLVHELAHIERFVSEHIGLNQDDDEAHCYLLEYLFNQCRPHIDEYHKEDK